MQVQCADHLELRAALIADMPPRALVNQMVPSEPRAKFSRVVAKLTAEHRFTLAHGALHDYRRERQARTLVYRTFHSARVPRKAQLNALHKLPSLGGSELDACTEPRAANKNLHRYTKAATFPSLRGFRRYIAGVCYRAR